MTDYNQVPYEGSSFPETHLDRLASIAALHGMIPKSPEHCRVLELGCANGENILPMASTFAESDFIAVDLSHRQIARAKEIAEQLELKNIEFRCEDILDIGSRYGLFDYIICHGIFSWVSKEVRQKIFEICSTCLDAQGVAYISYNVSPGWYFRDVVRDIMIYASRGLEDPRNQVAEAKNFLHLVALSTKGRDPLFAQLLERELKQIQKRPDTYLLHDYMEEVNEPVSFFEFMEQAEFYGLQYLEDARLSGQALEDLPEEVANTVRGMSLGRIQQEQSTDFLRNRMFRRSLLCRRSVSLATEISLADVSKCYVASALKLVLPTTKEPGSGYSDFRTPRGGSISLSDPCLKTLVEQLSRGWPQSVPVPEVLIELKRWFAKRSTSKQFGQDLDQKVCAWIRSQAQINLVELSLYPPRFTMEIGTAPKVSRLARLQAKDGSRIVNQRHESVELDTFSRHILALLDGSCKDEELLQAVQVLAKQGITVVAEDKTSVVVNYEDVETLKKLLDSTLLRIAQSALLLR